jgi:hypothetical protein
VSPPRIAAGRLQRLIGRRAAIGRPGGRRADLWRAAFRWVPFIGLASTIAGTVGAPGQARQGHSLRLPCAAHLA